MFKKSFLLFFVLIFLASFVVSAQAATPAQIIFCEGITETWEPVGASDTFSTNEVSFVFFADEPFGVMELTVSIYSYEGSGQNLVHRGVVEVSPEWSACFVAKIPFPSMGKYKITYSKTDGTLIAAGGVEITEKTVDKPMPENTQVEGVNLESLFNKYAPKN